ncbi:Putative amidoligase enzyme [Paenibacillus sp. 1_12]|uniref:amidoligase family protein n=1 Tax=Paenibacillus sp. 1_12 TaxID=1566278 RepID=UPI0008E5AB3D|nr:amidoligase family protein [Paenibacillus sp. 1_12]SFM42395.1 Putative amidoligase enzyme [Paenibacillus sp. 1_12]
MHVDFRELTFGIEIEFTGMRRATAANVVSDFFDTGRPRQIGGWGHDTYESQDRLGRVWKTVKDASIRPERKDNHDLVIESDDFQCELVSPILTYTDIQLLQELIRDLRIAGAITNNSCGIHVHIGAEAFTTNSLRVLCNIVYSKQALLTKALVVNNNRRKHCLDLSNEFIQKLNKKKSKTIEEFADVWYSGYNAITSRRNDRYNDSRYRVLNLHQLLSERLKTVEFRLFNSTLHAGKVKAYIQLSLLIASQALNQKKATSRVTLSENGNDKYTFRVWLLRLGAVSDEFKSMRKHLLKYLNGNPAWRDPQVSNEISNQELSEVSVR